MSRIKLQASQDRYSVCLYGFNAGVIGIDGRGHEGDTRTALAIDLKKCIMCMDVLSLYKRTHLRLYDGEFVPSRQNYFFTISMCFGVIGSG